MNGLRIAGWVLLLALLAAILGTQAAWYFGAPGLHRPVPTPGQLNGPPQEQATAGHAETDSSQRGTERAPLIVEVHAAPHSHIEAAENAAKEFRDAATQWGILGLTAILAVATLLQFVALWWQGRKLNAALKLANAEFVSTHRPKLRVRLFLLGELAEREPIVMQFQVANIGGTAATLVDDDLTLSFHRDKEGADWGRQHIRLNAKDTLMGAKIEAGASLTCAAKFGPPLGAASLTAYGVSVEIQGLDPVPRHRRDGPTDGLPSAVHGGAKRTLRLPRAD
jgi:hypothetical protein